jgi:AcrR family transcriptional regulator
MFMQAGMVPPERMARRLTQTEQRAETRRRLLDSARTLFARRGFAGASLDEIADGAGLTRGALYYNFPEGKDDLFMALLEERAKERVDLIGDKFAGSEGGPRGEALLSQARAAAHEWQANLPANREWRMIFFEFALHAARERRFATKFAKRETELRRGLVKLIEDMAADLDADLPLSADALAVAIIALGNGLALEDLAAPGSLPDEILEQVIGLMLVGIWATGRRPDGQRSSKGGRRR